MFRFVKTKLIGVLSFGATLVIKCVSMSNQPRYLKPSMVNMNSTEPL